MASGNLETSLVAQTVKRLSTMWETWVQSLGREDPLEKYPCLENSMDRGAWGSWCYSPRGPKESDTTERLTCSLSQSVRP